MNIKDCKVGMKVKCTTNEPRGTEYYGSSLKKGDTLTISAIQSDYDGINFEEAKATNCLWYPENFEPVNKFEIGDEAIVNFLNASKVKIWGKKYNKTMNEYLYAVQGCGWNDFCRESELSQLKKPDELEVGDKFKVKTAEGVSKRINEVLGVFEDEYFNQTKYVAKRLNGNYKGLVDIYNSEMIVEVIYD